MKPATILTLAVGDRIRDHNGEFGKVIEFTVNHVVIAWDRGSDGQYSDSDLSNCGVVKCSPFDDVEDTTP